MRVIERGTRGPAPARRGPVRRVWDAPLWAHAATLALLVLALFPFMTPEGAFTSDEGAYALQVDALSQGRWDYEYKAAPLDPEGDHFPLVLGDERDGRFYPYIKHPAYPLLLRGVTAIAGEVLGLHLLALAAVVVTAAAAWLLAAEVDRRLSRPAFWLAAASPVLVNGYLIWAHAPSAALAGLALVAAVRIAREGPSPRRLAALAALLAAGALLRSESLLFAGAVVAALGWSVLRRHGWARAALTAGSVSGSVVVAALAEERWIASITGGRTSTVAVRGGGGSYLAGRVSGAWHELAGSSAFGDAAGTALALVGAATLVVFGWIALRARRPHWAQDLLVGCGIAGVAYGARLVVAPHNPITGLVAAWPVAVLGVALVRWRKVGPELRWLGAASALFLLAVLATQYPQGGGLEWGGRFLSPAAVPLAVLAAAGLVDALAAARDRPVPARHLVAGALAGVAALTAVSGLATTGSMRAREMRLAEAVARHPAEVTVTTARSLPRSAWHLDDRITWMIAEESELGSLLSRLRAAGVRRVSVLTGAGTPVARISPYPRAERVREPSVDERGLALVALSG